MSYGKCVLVGDGGVGKTTFVTKLRTSEFEKMYIPTVGVEVRPLNAKLAIWDTAGQEKFGGIRNSYYQGATSAIVMFDLTSKLTFRRVPTWIRDLRSVCGDIPIVVVGNKADIADIKGRKVSFAEISSASWMNGDVVYCEISVKTGENINRPLALVL